ncbi:uncharacterized protein SCHCODRAFT_02585065 [Schizophyllum commune H4-8]|nr:uncharacterized protein SCHCODRAFT_02585065 [Schizophyllum commune H4-8]KAI5889114.1 hypothetical protein SCHCODRAFT_02585065 [Schizophyllum commune H4-8]
MTSTIRYVELPPELEWVIVEYAARIHPETAYTLALVAPRFKTWIDTLLYSSLVLDYPLTRPTLLLRTITDRDPDFIARTVKRIYITTSVAYADAARALAACSGVTDITCWTRPAPEFPGSGRVKRLSFDASSLLFAPKTLPALTHLDLVNPPPGTTMESWMALFAGLPALTHVAFGNLYAQEPVDHRPLIPLFLALLSGETGHDLKMLVAVSDDEDFVPFLHEEVDDPRAVVMPRFNYPRTLAEYWQDVQTGGLDFWGVAERLPVKQLEA